MTHQDIASFQVLTQDHPLLTHVSQALAALRGGAKWIQLRSKEKSRVEITALAREIKIICADFDAKLIINDHVEIVVETGADGVHLGKQDLAVTQARKVLGEDFIIGGTANTFDDVVVLAKAGADYAGLGPFRFTETKKKLAPVLGLEGIEKIVLSCREVGIHLPLVAIGGITLADAHEILQTGIHGLAVSSAVNLSGDAEKTVARFLKTIKGDHRIATVV